MKKYFSLLLFTFFIAVSLIGQDTTQQINYTTKNDPSQIKKPYVILISADGFRADFTEKYDAKFLQSVTKKAYVQNLWNRPFLLLLSQIIIQLLQDCILRTTDL